LTDGNCKRNGRKTDRIGIPVAIQFKTQLRQKPKNPNMRDGIIQPVTHQCDAEESNFKKQPPKVMDREVKPNFPVTS
jgi:hypothetical protein